MESEQDGITEQEVEERFLDQEIEARLIAWYILFTLYFAALFALAFTLPV
jgi:hypothetical protein